MSTWLRQIISIIPVVFFMILIITRLTFLAFVPGTGFWTGAGNGMAVALFSLGLTGLLTRTRQDRAPSILKSFLISVIPMLSGPIIILAISSRIWNDSGVAALVIACAATLETAFLSRRFRQLSVDDGTALLRG